MEKIELHEEGHCNTLLQSSGKLGQNRPFPSSPGPLFQNEGRCSAFDKEIIFHSHGNRTHFHKKGCAPSLILKVRDLFVSQNSPIIQGGMTTTKA